MKLGLISDAHGNIDGLEICLSALESQAVDRIYFLGDAVGYFPEVAGVIELLRTSDIHCLSGNHEAMLLGKLSVPTKAEEVYRLSEAFGTLSTEQRRELGNWPPELRLSIDGRKLMLVHGSPDDPLRGYVYPGSDLGPFADLDVDVVFMGHTHRPFISKSGRVSVVNVGSCGLPRDGGGPSLVLFDTRTGRASLLRPAWSPGIIVEKYKGRVHPRVIEVLKR